MNIFQLGQPAKLAEKRKIIMSSYFRKYFLKNYNNNIKSKAKLFAAALPTREGAAVEAAEGVPQRVPKLDAHGDRAAQHRRELQRQLLQVVAGQSPLTCAERITDMKFQ